MTGARMPLREFRLGPPLRQNARVVGALVFPFDPREQLIRRRIAHPVAFAETIGQREKKGDQCRLIFRIGLKNIEADAFRFARFVEQTVTLRFFQGRRDRFFGK